jgi:hypothetical protein
MPTRQQLTVWIPVALATLATVGYVEWRTSRATELAPRKEPLARVTPGAKASDSNKDQSAFALAAAANARAEKAERLMLDMKEHLARSTPTTEQASALTPAEKRETQRAEREAFLHELDQRVATEPLDPTFRSEKVAAITSMAATLSNQGVTLEKAECASSICKISLSHPSHKRLPRTAAMQFLKAAHTPGSGLTRLAFNFKYEDGATILYGTMPTPSDASEGS